MAGLLDREETERAISDAVLSHGFSNFVAEKVARDLRVDPHLQGRIAKAVAETSTIRQQVQRLGSVREYRRLSAKDRRVIVENVKDEIRHRICDLVCRRLTELLNSKNAITKMINLRVRYKTKEYYDRHLTLEKIRSLLPVDRSHVSSSSSEAESEDETDDDIYGEPWRFLRIQLSGIPSVEEPRDVETGEVEDEEVDNREQPANDSHIAKASG